MLFMPNLFLGIFLYMDKDSILKLVTAKLPLSVDLLSESLSEAENMCKVGARRLWDCWQYLFNINTNL